MKIVISYPSPEDEKWIFQQVHAHTVVEKMDTKNTTVWASSITVSGTELLEMQEYIEKNISIDPKIYDYISALLEMTRSRDGKWTVRNSQLSYGASTRAWLALIGGARICALLAGRDYVSPDDIKYIARDILRHRIGLSYEALANRISTDDIIEEILGKVRIP